MLRISATYETRRASRYESMGIMVVWEAYADGTGVDLFTHALDERGQVTHGHLPENNHHGGSMPLGVNLSKRRGHSITFVNQEASPLSTFNLGSPTPEYLGSVFHAVTACQNPCGLNTGISYPLANGAGNFDSGQRGIGTPAIGRLN